MSARDSQLDGPDSNRRHPAGLVGLLLCLSACAHPGGARRAAPFGVRSQHPAQLIVQKLVPIGGGAVSAGEVRSRWSNAYTSLFLAGSDDATGNTFQMDGEFWRTAVGARIGLPAGFEFDFEIPFGHASGGFLDDFVVEWHDAFGLPDQGRNRAPRDEYTVRAERSGQTAFEVEPHGFQVLDIPLELAWCFASPTQSQPFGGKIRAAVELPTGNEDRGLGNGELDVAFGLVGEYRDPSRGWSLAVHAEHTFAGQPDSAAAVGLEFRDVTSAGISGCVPLWWEGWSLLAQVEWETSTLRGLGFSRVSDDELNLWTGFRIDLADRTDLEIALGEDLGTFIAPDFTVWMTLQHAFGAPAE